MRMNYKTILGEMKKVCVGVSNTIYTTNRPETSDGIDNFIVCSLPVRQYDRVAYGETVCRFTLFAKDLSNVENYTKLADMQEMLLAKLPINNQVCAIWNPTIISGGSDKSGFHSLHIQCNLIIY